MTSMTQSCKMNRIILTLLEHGTKQKAAAALGMSESTVWRWMQKPEFQQAYHKVLSEYNCRKIGKLLQASSAAVATLCRLMVDPNTPPSVRVRAADRVLEHAKVSEQGVDVGTPHSPIPEIPIIIMPRAE